MTEKLSISVEKVRSVFINLKSYIFNIVLNSTMLWKYMDSRSNYTKSRYYRPQFDFWFRNIPCRSDTLPTPVFLGFPGVSAGIESAINLGDLGSIPGFRRLIPGLGGSPGEGTGYLLQYCGLENSMDCIVHGVTNSQTQLSDFHNFSNCYMATIILIITSNNSH